MRITRYIFGTACATVVVACAAGARADLVQPRWATPAASTPTVRPLVVTDVVADLSITPRDAAPPVRVNADETPSTVCQLPAVPNSSTLFLYALGTMGVWRLARVSWKWHTTLAPDWYHTDAPSQIGHVKLIGWDLGQIEWAVCPFTTPTAAETPHRICDADHDPPRGLEGYLPIFAPRGPPAACLAV